MAQAPSLSTAEGHHSQPVVKARSSTLRGTCTWGDSPLTAPTSSYRPSSGRPCSTTAMSAASVTFSLTAEVRTYVRSLRHKMALASNLRVPSSLANSVKATPARIEVSVRKAGTDSSVTVPALATGRAPVNEVNMCPLVFVSCIIKAAGLITSLWFKPHLCGWYCGVNDTFFNHLRVSAKLLDEVWLELSEHKPQN